MNGTALHLALRHRIGEQTALHELVNALDLVLAGLEPLDVPLLTQQPTPNDMRERQLDTFELFKAGF